MKKLLTFLTLLTLFTVTAWADTAIFTAVNTSTGSLTCDLTGVSADVEASGFGNSGWQVLGSGSCSITFSGFTSSYKLTGINIVYNTNKSAGKATASAKLGSTDVTSSSVTLQYGGSGDGRTQNYSADLDVIETTFNGDDLVVTVTGAGTNSVYVKSVTVTYAEAGSSTNKVATPTFSPAAGTYTTAQEVRISCETEGATIHYTMDGNAPDENSPVYSTPISVATAGTTTIKAIAMKDDMDNSSIATANYILNIPFTSLAAVNALADNTELTYGAETVVLGKNGKNLYIVMPDNEAGTLAYASSEWTDGFIFGQVINSGWSATKATYKEKPEVKNISNFNLKGATAQVIPLEITSGDVITKANFGRYAVIRNVEVADGGAFTYSNITTYNELNYTFTDVTSGNYDVYGIIGWYNGNGQFWPLRYEEIEVQKFAVSCNNAENGSISTDKDEYAAGSTVNVTVTPAPGYELATLVYNDGEDHDIKEAKSFTMPASDVTVTATFAKIKYAITYNVLPANSGIVWVLSGDEVGGVKMAEEGTRITIKQVPYNNYFMNTLTIKDANGNTISYDTGETNSDGGGYGTYFMFDMPASNVTITATFKPGDMYILGTLNEKAWAGNDGVQMTYDSENEKWTADVYVKNADATFSFTERLGDANWNNMGPRYAAEENDYDLTAHNNSGALQSTNVNNAFLLPAGIYTIEIDKGKTQVTVTPIHPVFTFSPAAGKVESGTPVSVSSNLYELLHAINSNIEESAVSNQVKIGEGEGEYAASVQITEAATVTGRAKFNNIEETAKAKYTIQGAPGENVYTLVESEDDLVAGGEYLIVGSTSTDPYCAILGALAGSGASYAQAILNDSENTYFTYDESAKTITLADVESEITPLTLGGTAGAWTFNNGAGYLAYTMPTGTTKNNNLWLNESPDDNGSKWTINSDLLASGSNALITNAYNNERKLQYNGDRFAGYTGSQSKVSLFKKGSTTPKVATPTFDPEGGTYTEAQNVTISCDTEGATIQYSTDGETYRNYTGAITVSETTTIYAKASKQGYATSEASATYTIREPAIVGDGDYVKVTNTADLTSGEYLIVYEEGSVAFNGGLETLDAVSNNIAVVINDNTIASNETVDAATFTIDVTAGTIKSASGYYIGNSSYANALKKSDNASEYVNTFSIDADGNAVITAYYNNATTNTQLRFNAASDQKRFRYFKDNGQNPIALYKKVVEEPATEITLAGLESSGVKGKKYAISDELVAVEYKLDGDVALLWCKDDNGATPIAPATGVVDFMVNDGTQTAAWDQSNWVVIKTTDQAIGANFEGAKGKKISGVTGTYVDDVNYMIEVDGNFTIGEDATANLNNYCVANFNSSNWGADGVVQNAVGNEAPNPQPFFFMTPKVQEVCIINYAQWNGTNFVVPVTSGFTGELNVDYKYNSTSQADVEAAMNDNLSSSEVDRPYYTFTAIVQVPTAGSAHLKGNLTGGAVVYPTDFTAGEPTDPTTAISTVGVNGEVKSVKYVNVAGVVSDRPFQGVNIVVTEYSDGSRTTTKVVK